MYSRFRTPRMGALPVHSERNSFHDWSTAPGAQPATTAPLVKAVGAVRELFDPEREG